MIFRNPTVMSHLPYYMYRWFGKLLFIITWFGKLLFIITYYLARADSDFMVVKSLLIPS